MSAAASLAYVAAMQEIGIAVTYAFSCGKLTAKQAKTFTERATQLLNEAVNLNIN